MNELPLSWNFSPAGVSYYNYLPLSSGKAFIYSGCLPEINPQKTFVDLRALFPAGFVLRGASAHFADAFHHKQALRTQLCGSLSVEVSLKPLQISRSIEELASRGARRLQFKEIDPAYSAQALQHIEHPALTAKRFRYLYQHETREGLRYFTGTRNDQPVIFISISQNAAECAHLELFCRNRCTKPGDMEFVLVTLAKGLAAEGFRWLSLGEVADYSAGKARSVRESLLRQAGKLPVSGLSPRGLFTFKTRFASELRQRYWVGYPTLQLRDLYSIARITGYLPRPLQSVMRMNGASPSTLASHLFQPCGRPDLRENLLLRPSFPGVDTLQ